MANEVVDFSGFPNMLGKLDQKEQVINELVEIIEKLAEYIRKGFRMKPGDSETFEFDYETNCHLRVNFMLSNDGGYIFEFGSVIAGSFYPVKINQKKLKSFSLSGFGQFVQNLPKLVASVRGRLQSEINEMEEIKTVVKQCSL